MGDIEELCALCAPLPAGSPVTSFPMKAAKKKAREELDIVNVIEWRSKAAGERWFLLVRRPEGGKSTLLAPPSRTTIYACRADARHPTRRAPRQPARVSHRPECPCDYDCRRMHRDSGHAFVRPARRPTRRRNLGRSAAAYECRRLEHPADREDGACGRCHPHFLPHQEDISHSVGHFGGWRRSPSVPGVQVAQPASPGRRTC